MSLERDVARGAAVSATHCFLSFLEFHGRTRLSGCILSLFSMSFKMWILTNLQMSAVNERQAKRQPFSLPAVKREGRTPGAAPALSQIGE